MPEAAARDEAGSAAVEYTLVSVLLVVIVAGLFQLALALHVRNTLTSAAAEGARHASRADVGLDAGADRTREMVEGALGGYPVSVTVRIETVNGAPVDVVEVRAPVPVLGLWGFGTMTVDARAYEEVFRGES